MLSNTWFSPLLLSVIVASAEDVVIPTCLSMTGVKLDGKSIWKIHMDFFFENPFFS